MALAQLTAFDWRQRPDSPSMLLRKQRQALIVPLPSQKKTALGLRRQLRSYLFVIIGSKDRLATRFKQCVVQWRKETLALSSIPAKINHPSYLKIIAMGPMICPLILQELRDRPT